jgi:hypothetical protein
MNVEGETLRIWGRVVAKDSCENFGLVNLELGIVNGVQKESTPGTAVVALPYEHGRSVPYPFVPPLGGYSKT